MAEKSIKTNYIYNLGYQILLIITPLITTPYVSRVLGADGVGEYSFSSSIVSYFVLFAVMGTSLYGQREISFCQNDIEQRSKVFWNVVSFRIVSCIICLIIYCICVYACVTDNTTIYLAFSGNIIFVAFDISWFYQGLEEFKKIAIRNMIFKVVGILLIFVFIDSRDDLLLYVILSVGSSLVSAWSLWFTVNKYLIGVSKESITPFKDIKVILSLFVPTIAVQIYTVLDKTMIGLITGDNYENGYYEQGLKISKMTLTIVTALGTVMVPRIGNLYAQKKNQEVQKCLYRGYTFVWFLGIPLCFGIIGISNNIVPWFFGPGYDKVSLLLKILAFLILAIGINNVTGVQYLIPTERQKIFTQTVICGAVVNFILNICCIPVFGAAGAAVASVAAETTIAIVQLYYVRRELDWRIILKAASKYFLAGGIMLVTLIFLEIHLNASFISTMLMISLGALVYFGCLIALKDDFFLGFIKEGRKKLMHIKKG